MRRYLQAEFYKLSHRNYARVILLAVPVLVMGCLAMMVSQRSHGAACWTFHKVIDLSIGLLAFQRREIHWWEGAGPLPPKA